MNVAAQQADPESLLSAIRKMIGLRKGHPSLVNGEFTWLDCGTITILAFHRTVEQEELVAIHNLSSLPQEAHIPVKADNPAWIDLISGQLIPANNNELDVILRPYQYLWLI